MTATSRFLLMRAVLVLTLACSLVLAAPSPAAADGGEAVITSEVPTAHTLTVVGDHAGASYAGREGASFRVPRHEAFVLAVWPHAGHEVVRMTLEGEDVTESWAGGALVLSGIRRDCTLVVETRPVPATEAGGPSDAGKGVASVRPLAATPQTGDASPLEALAALAAFSLCLAAVACRRGKEDAGS